MAAGGDNRPLTLAQAASRGWRAQHPGVVRHQACAGEASSNALDVGIDLGHASISVMISIIVHLSASELEERGGGLLRPPGTHGELIDFVSSRATPRRARFFLPKFVDSVPRPMRCVSKEVPGNISQRTHAFVRAASARCHFATSELTVLSPTAQHHPAQGRRRQALPAARPDGTCLAAQQQTSRYTVGYSILPGVTSPVALRS